VLCQEGFGRMNATGRDVLRGPVQGTTVDREIPSRPGALHKLGILLHYRVNFRRGCDRTQTVLVGGPFPARLRLLASILPGLLTAPCGVVDR
jgi:hypothetical protein